MKLTSKFKEANEELFKLKKELAAKIAPLIAEFESQTGLNVQQISVHHSLISTGILAPVRRGYLDSIDIETESTEDVGLRNSYQPAIPAN